MSAETTPTREALAEWLRISRTGAGAYEAELENHFGEAQGGDLLARLALAALAEQGTGELKSLNAEWLTPARPGPVALRTERLDGAGTCALRASSGERELCRAIARCAPSAGAGPAYQDETLPPALPDPDALPSAVEYARKEGWPELYAAGPVEFRRVGPLRPNRAAGVRSDHITWLALRARLPQDPQLAQAALVFLACFYAHWEFERRVGERFDYAGFAVRWQRVQLHRAARPDGWLLLHASSRLAANGVARSSRALFARGGTLLASVETEANVAEA